MGLDFHWEGICHYSSCYPRLLLFPLFEHCVARASEECVYCTVDYYFLAGGGGSANSTCKLVNSAKSDCWGAKTDCWGGGFF